MIAPIPPTSSSSRPGGCGFEIITKEPRAMTEGMA
jgi:hypothetical protein